MSLISTKSLPTGVLTALITPIDDRDAPDIAAIRTLVDFQVDAGIDGLFVLGSAGQGPMLSPGERRALARAIIDAAAGRLRVVVHVGVLPTSAAVSLAADAVDAGADAVAAVPPTYYGPDSVAVRRYYEALRSAVPDRPLLAYNNPSATAYDLRPNEAAELCREGTIDGVKQASANVADLHALLRAGVPVWMANATLNAGAWTMGAVGSISTITNVVPELFVALARAMHESDLPRARNLQARIDRASARLRQPTIGALHAAASLRGLPAGVPRPPLRMPTDEELEVIRGSLDELVGT